MSGLSLVKKSQSGTQLYPLHGRGHSPFSEALTWVELLTADAIKHMGLVRVGNAKRT